MPIEVPAGGAAFHDGWTFHGSPPNERADAERRSIISHMVSTETDVEATAPPHPVYSRYRRPGERELDEAFFPVHVARRRAPHRLARRLSAAPRRSGAGTSGRYPG